MSAEGAALSRFKHRDLGDLQIHLCRAFGTHSSLRLNPGLTAGPSHCRSFGPDREFAAASAARPYDYLGVASGRPPSTGIVAPVVGLWRVAK